MLSLTLLLLFFVYSYGFMTTIYRSSSPMSLNMAKEVVTKAELLELLKDKTGVTKKDIDSVLGALTDSIRECVLDGGKEIRLRDFGTFKPKVTKARMGRNPRTGEAIPVSGSTSVGFSAATAFKRKNQE